VGSFATSILTSSSSLVSSFVHLHFAYKIASVAPDKSGFSHDLSAAWSSRGSQTSTAKAVINAVECAAFLNLIRGVAYTQLFLDHLHLNHPPDFIRLPSRRRSPVVLLSSGRLNGDDLSGSDMSTTAVELQNSG
jgi:hypothetical protein